MLKRSLLALSALFTVQCAAADGLSIGGLALISPSVSGGDLDTLTLVPAITYATGPWTFGGQGLVAYQIGEDAGVRAELALGYDFGQDGDGAPAVGFAATAGATLAYRHPFFELSATTTTRLFADVGGSTLALSAGTGYPLTQDLFLAVSATATYADGARRAGFYGLDGAGYEKTALSALGFYTLNDNWSLLGGVTYSQLADEIADLAFIDGAGSTSLMAGVTYSF